MTPDFLLHVIVSVASGAAVYGAIRADLATLHERSKNQGEAIKDIFNLLDKQK